MNRLLLRRGVPSHRTTVWLVLLVVAAAAGVVQLWAGRDFEVARATEALRATPQGRRLGSLVEGTRVEELARDGKWVKVRVEGWIWGPALEGFEGPEEEAEESAAPDAPRAGVKQEAGREPRPAVNVHRDEVRDLINQQYGQFYGISLDPDLDELQVRFRVPPLEPEALESRQMRVQHEVFQILEGEVEFARVRVETNRADGSGEVGVEIAVTSVQDIRRVDGDDLELWRQQTRRSRDTGQTWTGPR